MFIQRTDDGSIDTEVSFQWKTPDFLLRNVDFLLRNVDFPSNNDDFIIKQVWPDTCAAAERLWTPDTFAFDGAEALLRVIPHRCRMYQRGIRAKSLDGTFLPPPALALSPPVLPSLPLSFPSSL